MLSLGNVLILLTAAVLIGAAPVDARAQDPELGISYSFVRITNGNGLNLPAGFLMSVADSAESLSLVGEIGMNFRSENGATFKLYTFQGGVRASTRTGTGTRAFGQLLLGITSIRPGRGSETKFSIEPAAGLDVDVSPGVGLRVGVGVPFVFTEGENLKLVRFQVGIVLGGRR